MWDLKQGIIVAYWMKISKFICQLNIREELLYIEERSNQVDQFSIVYLRYVFHKYFLFSFK